jgi:hypothetical protein
LQAKQVCKTSRIHLFHAGLDFAVELGSSTPSPVLVTGSYRNLFQDKAYGIQPGWVDAVAQKAVSDFFFDQGYAASREVSASWSRFASLSCDGLPLVGALPAYPGVFIVSGFGGREENFFFEACRRITDQFVLGRPDPQLGPLSPKRLV